MNLALLYRQNSRSIFWIAFMSALTIHVGAVALAKTKSPAAKLEDFSPAGEVDLVDTGEPEPPLAERIVHASAARADSSGSGQFPGRESDASASSRASKGTISALWHSNDGVISFGKSNAGLCAPPDLSVRSAPSTNNRIRCRTAHGRSRPRHRY